MSALGSGLARLCLVLATGLVLAACTKEHEVTTDEFMQWNERAAFEVDGDPFSGVLVARDGDVVRMRIEMEDGHPDGLVEEFDSDGKKVESMEVAWDQDARKALKDGERTRWNADGERILHEEYEDDEIVSRKAWCNDGKHKSEAAFDKGTPVSEVTWSCETGEQTLARRYKDGKLDGEQQQWADDGTLVAKLHYKAGELDGLQEAWYPDGKQRSRAQFVAGVPTGKHEAWNGKGTLAESGSYDDKGNKRGLWLETSASSWTDGTWITYSAEGTAPQQQHYGPDGFIDPQWVAPYVQALGDGGKGEPDTVAFYLKEGKVKVGDALPATYDGSASASPFEFPQSRWTYAVVVASDAVLPTLLANGADINQAASNGQTRLMRCAAYFNRNVRYGGRGCSPAALADLLAKGAKAGAVDVDGRNALHFLVDDTSDRDETIWGRTDANAAKARSDAIVALVKGGAEIDARDREGWTPLVRALAERRTDLANTLLGQGASVQVEGPNGTMPIHWVFLTAPDSYRIREDEFTSTMLGELARRGADVNAPMAWGDSKVTLRDLALRHGMIDIVRQLDGLARK